MNASLSDLTLPPLKGLEMKQFQKPGYNCIVIELGGKNQTNESL